MYSPDDILFPLPELNVMFKTHGGFARQVLAIVRKEDHRTEGNDFLDKILTAAGLKLEQDVALAVLEPALNVSIFPFPEGKRPEVILVFGFTPQELGLRLDAAMYTPIDFYGALFLFAHKSTELQPDVDKKSQLWRALQLVFLK